MRRKGPTLFINAIRLLSSGKNGALKRVDGRISLARGFIYKVTPLSVKRGQAGDFFLRRPSIAAKEMPLQEETYPELNRRSYGPPPSFTQRSTLPFPPCAPSAHYGRAAAFESSKRLIRCQVARDLARINAIRDISHPADIITRPAGIKCSARQNGVSTTVTESEFRSIKRSIRRSAKHPRKSRQRR